MQQYNVAGMESLSATSLGPGEWTVIIAMIPVGMMQVSFNQVVDVVTVRHDFVPASWTVHMRAVMSPALVLGRAPVRIGRRHLDGVLVDMILVSVVQMAVVKIINVIAVANGCMPTPWTVLVGMVGVLVVTASAHLTASSRFAIVMHGPAIR
jgi:hypothetical protein